MASPPRFMTYRVRGLPLRITKDVLLQTLLDHDLSIASTSLALDEAQTQEKVATITIDESSDEQKVKVRNFRMVLDGADIRFNVFDKEMLGLTPLNEIQVSDQVVDVVGITGLAGRAFDSWQSSNGKMWLRDLLPRDIQNLRVHIYGYDSKLKDSNSFARLLDYTTAFAETLLRFFKARKRPLILIGHSLGCLIIKQAVCDIFPDEAYRSLRVYLHSIVFFGAPHDGMDVKSLESRTQDTITANAIQELRRDSSVLIILKSHFGRLAQDLSILTCYETRLTPTIEVAPDGSWNRTGDPVMMVDRHSSCLGFANEVRIPLSADHSEIAKLFAGQEYSQIRDRIKSFAKEAPGVVRVRHLSAECAQIMEQIIATVNKILIVVGKFSTEIYTSAHDLSALDTMTQRIAALPAVNEAFALLFRQSRLDDLLLKSPLTEDFARKIEHQVQSLSNLFNEYKVVLQEYTNVEALHHSQAQFQNRQSLDEYSFRFVHGGLFHMESLALLCHRAMEIFAGLKQIISLLFLGSDISLLEAFANTSEAQSAGLHRTALRQLFLRRSQAQLELEQALCGNQRQGRLVKATKENDSDLTLGTWEGMDGSSRQVLVQYRSYVDQDTTAARGQQLNKLLEDQKRKKEQIDRLAWVLRNVSSDFQNSEGPQKESESNLVDGMLNFWDHIDHVEEGKVALLYVLPQSESSMNQITIQSLHGQIKLAKDEKALPIALERRFAMAKSLCLSVLTLHSWGWVHKDIRSDNVVVFMNSGYGKFIAKVDTRSVPSLDETYLAGFEFARHTQDISDRTSTSEKEQNLYRHPERQGVPRQNFTKIHDLYALGVVLYEIGVYRTIASRMGNFLKPYETENLAPKSKDISNAILKVASTELPAAMGTKYTEAVISCLEGNFDTKRDNESGSELGLRFHEKVLDKIGKLV